MKKILNISSLIIIGVSVCWLVLLYSPVKNENAPQLDNNNALLQKGMLEFKSFPLNVKMVVDFEDGNDIFDGLTLREKHDQIKDWLIYTIISESGLSSEEISKILYDLPPVRYGYISPVANFEYGEIRSSLIGDGKIVALLPVVNKEGEPITENQEYDYLAHIADEHRKNVGEIPLQLIVFKYEIDLEEQFALLWRQESINGRDLFAEKYGYYEAKINNLDEFKLFAKKIDDITFAKLVDNSIILGGRKLKGSQYSGIRVEDIAAIWQSEKLIHKKIEEFNTYWQNKVTELNAKWSEKTYRTSSEKTNLEYQYNIELEELKRNIATAHIKEKLVNASGFSLDPMYDYEGLKSYFKSTQQSLKKLIDAGSSAIKLEDIVKVSESLEKIDVTSKLSHPEVPLLILIDKLMKSDNPLDSMFGQLHHVGVEKYRFQAARYDGYLQGTEVGMILFYTDLLAKIWAIDYMKSAPDELVEDFVKLTSVNLSTIYMKESEELPSCRLWFGYKNNGFQVADEGKSILFARNATRIFAASSNPLKPGVEVPASAHFSATLSWWNNHYEEIAAYEHEYEKLNQIMKWSLLIGWLNDKGKEDILDLLKSIDVVRSNWFPEWADKKSKLKFDQWKKVSFYPRDYKDSKTEAMPILYSYPYSMFDREGVLSGGVSLAGKNVFKDLKPVLPSIGKTVRRPNLNYASSSGKALKTLEGISYDFNKIARNQMEILAIPPKEAVMRGTNSQLIRSNFKSVISKDNPNFFRIDSNVGDSGLGTFGIGKTESGFKLAWKRRDIDAGQSLGNFISKEQSSYQALAKNSNVESFIKLSGENNYLVKEANSDKWVLLSPESAASADIQAGWTSRVSDVNKGHRNINLRWVENKAVLNELGNEGAIVIDSVSNNKIIMQNITSQNFAENTVKAELQNGNMSIKAYVNPKTGKVYLPKNELPNELKAGSFGIKNIIKENDFKQISTLAAKKNSFVYNMSEARYSDAHIFARNVENNNYQALARELSDSPSTFIGQRNQILNDKIAHIDRLMEGGNNNKAYYELENLIHNYGPRPKLTGRLETSQIRHRLGKINNGENEFLLFTVKDQKTGYVILDESGKHIYEGNNISEAMNKFDQKFASDKARTIYLDMKDFSSPDKIEAFASSCRFQRSKHPDIFVKTLRREGGKTGMQDLFFTGKIELVKPLRVIKTELVTKGSYKGLYKATLKGVAKVKGVVRNIVIEIYTKTAQLADEFVMLLNLRFSIVNSNPVMGAGMKYSIKLRRYKSPAKLVNEVRRELIFKYNLKEEDLMIKFGDEIGKTETVFLFRKDVNIG